MLIQTFFLKVINNGRKVLTHHEIIDRITEQVNNQNCEFIQTYVGQISHLLHHLNSRLFLL